MQIEQLNAVIRETFTELVNDGYKKSHICGVTLGVSNVPQFDSFMKGVDFGIKPLQRIIGNQEFELKIVVTPKNNEEISKFINNLNHESIKNIKTNMIKTLDNESSVRLASIPKTGAIAGVASDLFNEIVK